MEIPPGQIVILNGAPRSGKTSIARVIQETFEGLWLNLGVDAFANGITPARSSPGIGLRPGGERPDLEETVEALYAALFESVAACGRLGLSVVVDVGFHDAYSRPLGLLGKCARRLEGLTVLFVGVRCPLETIMERRNSGPAGYLCATEQDPTPLPVRLWQSEVHRPGLYDFELDSSTMSPTECAEAIGRRLREGPPGEAFRRASVP